MAVDEVEVISILWAIASMLVGVIAWRNSSVLKEKMDFLHQEVQRFRDIVDKLRDEVRESK